MFGYIKPNKEQLKVIELERFKSIYCGLCTSIRRRYGGVYSNFLSYDITYFALVLGSLDDGFQTEQLRCVASPIRKKNVEVASGVIDFSADISILLSYYKILDNIKDEKHNLKYKIILLFLKPAYNKAVKNQSGANLIIKTHLQNLDVLESAGEIHLDKVAEPFAKLLSELSQTYKEDLAIKEIFYHIGKWIYIIDAIKDTKEDFIKNEYNPIIARFNLTDGKIDANAREIINNILGASITRIREAVDLLDSKKDKEIIENIVNLGLIDIMSDVLQEENNESI